MEHPLITGLDLLTPDQLLEKISELNRKLAFAYRSGNVNLCNQIRMAIDSHQSIYQEKTRRNPGTAFDDVIDIS
jgi:predicted ABC-type ATPase